MRERKPKKPSFEDDGRVIAPMNVDGMPWYSHKAPRTGQECNPSEKLSREEARAYRFAALKSALLIVAVFGAAGAAFIGFCLLIWKLL
ncbi:MAG: hypothetical protein GXY20_11215 [Clostridiales bacterium]|jgi:hypothetical protein|nr:hypothetical protein [Clostridiales bacterium]